MINCELSYPHSHTLVQEFSKKLPEHFEDLLNALPFSEYVRPNGILNMISTLPEKANRPDLGPKWYRHQCSPHINTYFLR